MKKDIRFLAIRKFLIGIFIFGLLLMFAGCEDEQCPARDILVLYAFDAEGELLAEEMAIYSSATMMGHPVQFGTLAGTLEYIQAAPIENSLIGE